MDFINNCIIVIPLYKEKPSKIELASFKQCLKVLNRYDICLITYNELDLTIYKNVIKESTIKYNINYFDKFYFNSIKGYNRLCLSQEFYKIFDRYKYMLIYQLDAWVFKDELDYWCNKEYDYIGAPWFTINENAEYTKKYNGIGNGGFSLRKISFCIDVLNYNRPFINLKHLIKTIHKPLDVLKVIIKMTGFRNNLSFYVKNNKINEDCLFSQMVLKSNIKANLPDEQTALKFAFEVNPSYLYIQNNKVLPFGCHAFEKYEFESFWKKIINLD